MAEQNFISMKMEKFRNKALTQETEGSFFMTSKSTSRYFKFIKAISIAYINKHWDRLELISTLIFLKYQTMFRI